MLLQKLWHVNGQTEIPDEALLSEIFRHRSNAIQEADMHIINFSFGLPKKWAWLKNAGEKGGQLKVSV